MQNPTFATNPAAVNREVNFVDYGTSVGTKIYKAATMPLEYKFDLDAENLPLLLEAVETRAISQGWDQTILRITVGQGNAATHHDILTNYGTLSYDEVKAFVTTYAFTESRQFQDAINAHTALKESLTEDALKTILAKKDMYTLRRSELQAPANGWPASTPEYYYDGTLFLFVLISSASAKTNATLSVIVHRLQNLTVTMQDKDSNIKEFNTFVNNQLASYYAFKRQKYDSEILLTSLFTAYQSCDDKEFVKYITRKNEDHTDGITMTVSQLMENAFKHYQTRVVQNVWKAQTEEQKELVSLAAKLDVATKKSEQLRKDLTKFKKNNKQKGDGKGKGGNKQKTGAERRKERYDKAPAWMKKAPTNGKGTMTHDGDTYYWCPTHKLWQKHKPNECRLKKHLQNSTNSNESEKDKDNKHQKTGELELNERLATIAKEEDALDYDI